ncbi:PhoH family protein [Bergeyella porcorum]|uniref:PhoH family protein n=1 Tax=Bergeyella porcorum TaxID=1735111 RepID=UPI0035F063F7
MFELNYELTGIDTKTFYGVQNQNFNLIKSSFPTLKITGRDSYIFAMGTQEALDVLKQKLDDIVAFISNHNAISIKEVESILKIKDETEKQLIFDQDIIVKGVSGKIIKAKTTNLKKLVKEVEQKDMVFAIGPAGTGKTYTSVALAARALRDKEVKRIILTRPAVEAGESLGFLPGDLKEKLDPYLQPLYDALRDMIPHEKLENFIEKKVIEVAPLAFMRGRTLDDAFVILDEAQNTTHSQMKMFLTRMGMNAKFIITGDPSQVDLPLKQKSGLREAIRILKDVKEIGFIHLTEEDVVRHPVVKKIILAYNQEEKRQREEA